MKKEYEVQQIKPVPVRIYDYYEPGIIKLKKSYNFIVTKPYNQN